MPNTNIYITQYIPPKAKDLYDSLSAFSLPIASSEDAPQFVQVDHTPS